MAFGHTHYPMLWPTDAAGSRVKYANSGCGVLDGAFSALEWVPDHDEPLRLVLWMAEGDDLRRVELVPDEGALTPR